LPGDCRGGHVSWRDVVSHEVFGFPPRRGSGLSRWQTTLWVNRDREPLLSALKIGVNFLSACKRDVPKAALDRHF
jgi:hypothetical protein